MDRSPAGPEAANEVLIDLGEAADPAARTDRPRAARGSRAARPMMGRRTTAVRVVVMLALALAAGLPRATAPMLRSEGRTVPLPSYCTGKPIPGGRLNIVRDDTYIILDATTGTIVNTGRCPHGTGTRSNDGN